MYCCGIEGLIGESFAAITGKTAEAAVAGGIAAHKHDAGWPAGVALEPAEVNAALGQQPAEGITDGIAAKAAHKSCWRAKPGQGAGHVGGGATQAVIALIRGSCGGVTAEGSKPIHQGFPKTDHLRRSSHGSGGLRPQRHCFQLANARARRQ